MGKNRRLRWLLPVLGIVFLLLQWSLDTVQPDNLLLEVPEVRMLSWLETPYAYLFLHLFTFIPVFALSFDKKVHYYKKWKYLLPAIIPVAAFFVVWDVFFTEKGVWGFNHEYLSGIYLVNLPVEEWLFFFTVPFACVFIYECLNFYVKKDLLRPIAPFLTNFLILAFFAIGIWKFWHMYTATTFILAGGFLLYHKLFEEGSYRSRFYLAYLVSWVPFLIVNGVLTGGYTKEPVVIYNPEEYLGIRITSVPLDDSIYSFLLLLMVVTLFERFRAKPKPLQ
jgi:lycopene cyclase domain-containing protein